MKKNRKHLKVYFILLLAFLVNLTIQAQSINNDKIAPLFRSDDMLELKISADFKKLLLIKDDSTYFPAQLYLINDSIVSTPLSLEIRTRGKTRRERDVCKFTPLRLKFKKKTTKNKKTTKKKEKQT